MAVPHPDKELDRLRSRVKTALSPTTLITGASAYFRSEATDIAFAAVPQGRDLRVIEGQTETDGSELHSLRGASLFGGGGWLVVRRAEPWLAEHGDTLLPLLTSMGRNCGLIIEAQKVDKRTKLGKALATHDSYEFRELYDSPFDRTKSPLEAELVSWVAQRSRGLNVRMTLEAAFIAVITVGKDPGEMMAELRRLSTQPDVQQLAKTRPLTPDDLRGRLTCAFESTPFELAEAWLDHDRARCLRSLDAMFGRGVKGRDGKAMDPGGVFPFTMSWLFQAVAKAHRGRMLLDAGTPASAIGQQMGVHMFADRFVRQVTRNPAARLQHGLSLLLDTQRRLRSAGEHHQRLLESMVARYFGAEL